MQIPSAIVPGAEARAHRLVLLVCSNRNSLPSLKCSVASVKAGFEVYCVACVLAYSPRVTRSGYQLPAAEVFVKRL